MAVKLAAEDARRQILDAAAEKIDKARWLTQEGG
jgi:hypothetical protein